VRPLQRPDNRLYLGRGGSGKSYLALRHAESFARVLFVRSDENETPPFDWTHDEERLARLMYAPSFKVAFITDGREHAFEHAARCAMRYGDVVVMWEEAATLMRGPRLTPHAAALWTMGRHRGCRVFATTQRPARIVADCRANVGRMIIFQTGEASDLKFYRDVTGDRDLIDAIRALDYSKHEAIDRTDSAWEVKTSPFD
jgi:hypothetical protein